MGRLNRCPGPGRVEGVLRLAGRALIDGSGEAGVPVVQPYQRLHLQPHVVLLDRLRRPRGAAAVADEVGAPEVDEGQFHAAGHVTCSRASRSRDRRSGVKYLDVICIERGVGGDQLERFQLRHRDEQPVERIAMMIRQLCHAAGVMVLDG